MSDDNVVSIHGGPAALAPGVVDHGVVSVLEDLLARAKTGNLRCLVMTGFIVGGDRIAAHAGAHENILEMRGAIAWLETEYVARTTGRPLL